MDSLQLYNYHYNRVNSNFKKIVMPYLKMANDDDRPYDYIYDLIKDELKEKILPKLKNGIDKKHPIACKFYNCRYQYYNLEDKIAQKKVFENEISEYFQKINSALLRPFIVDLAIENAVDDLLRHLNDYFGYYKLAYDVKKWEYFSLKPFVGIHYEDSKEFEEMRVLKYGKVVIEKEKVTYGEQEGLDSKKKNFNERNNEFGELFGSFTDDERLLIANVFFDIKNNKQEGLSIPSFLKLNRIVGDCKDESIYLIKGNYNTSYTKVNKGIEYYSSYKTQIDLLDSTITKLNNLELKVISSKLKRVKYQLKKA